MAAENNIAAEKAGKKCVMGCFFAGRRSVAEKQHGRFVDQGEDRKVASVRPGGFDDDAELFPKPVARE
ncbi:hypothetical protein MMC13_008391 [Lambiella insularis]|nr:hypothetical protein [Lambiella insularis]